MVLPPELAVSCPGCGHVSRVPAAFAGREGRCPACRELVQVEQGAPLAPPREAPQRAPSRPCRGCGEEIHERARLCRYCGAYQQEGIAPRGRAEGNYRLPSPGRRFLAWLIDSLIVYVPGWAAFGAVLVTFAATSTPDKDFGPPLGILMGALVTVALATLQWIQLVRTGATWGKRWMKMRLVRDDNGPLTFANAVFLRHIVPGLLLLMGSCFYMFGGLFWLLDSLCVLGRDRRCLHDFLAGTRVIDARFGVPTALHPSPVQAD